MSGQEKSLNQLWQEYLFLSKELHKFVGTDDVDLDLCADLLKQRQTLFDHIATLPGARAYAASPEGREMLTQLTELDKSLRQQMLKVRNLLHKDMEVSAAYDGFLGDSAAVGTRFDSGRG